MPFSVVSGSINKMVRTKRAIVGIVIGFVAGLYPLLNKAVIGATQAQTKTAASVDFCADQYLLALAPAKRIVGLSPDARSAYSSVRGQATTHKLYNPRTENLLSLKPNIVVRQWGGAPRLAQALTAHGIDVVQLGYVTDFDGIYANIRQVGEAIDAPEKAEALIRTITAVQAKAPDSGVSSGQKPSALYVTPGGVTAGRGTLIDAIFSAAGLTNRAATNGATGWVPLSAEALILDPPDLLVTGFFDGPLNKANAWSPARHPVFEKLFARVPTITLRVDQISCAGPASIEAVNALRRAIAAMRATGRLTKAGQP